VTESPERQRSSRRPWLPLMPRVMSRIEHDPNTGCWKWIEKTTRYGYAVINWKGRQWLAHRAVYTKLRGAIPEGLEIDHLCDNKACVNPMHLEAVPHQVNIVRSNGAAAENARKTHCKRGHELAGENLYRQVGPYGVQRVCRSCVRLRERERYAQQKESA
jgi:hypothetical protein